MLVGEASIRLDAIADDLKKTINRDINEALAGVKIDSDPLVKMTQNLRKAELDLITAEDQLTAAHRGTIETEAKLENLRRSGTATTNEISSAERALTRARAEEAVLADKVTVSTQKLAAAHGALTKSQKDGEVQQKSWIRSVLGSSNVIDSASSKLNIFSRRNKDAGDESVRTGRKLRSAGNDASGLGKVLDGALGGVLKLVSGQFSAMGDVGSGVFTTLTSKAVLLPAALAPLLGVVGGLIIALPALAAVGGVALGAIALGLDGVKRAFKPLTDDLDALKAKVSSSFESALAPAVAKMPALFGAATTGLQAMATALGGLVTRITTLLTSSENLAKIRDLFIQTAFFIKAMGPGIQQFTQGFLNLASAVAPQLEKLGGAIGGILGAIGGAFDRLNQLGLVKPAIDGLVQVFGALARLIGPVLEIFGRLAATLQGPLATVIDAIASGLQAAMPGIQAFADGIGKALVALAPALTAVLPLVGQVAGLIGGVLGVAIQTLAPPLTKLITGLTAGLAPILPKIADAFVSVGNALAPVLDQLAGALLDAVLQLIPIIPQLLGAIVELVPSFLSLVTAVIPLLPPLVQLAATILPALIRLWLLIEKPSLAFANVLIGQVVPAVLLLLKVVQSVVTGVVNFFTDFDTNLSKIWANVTGFFSKIGSAISGVFGDIGQFFSDLGSKIGGFFSGLGSKIASGFTSAIDFIKGLPGKIGSFLASLPSVVGNAMLDAAKAMLHAAVEGVEWVIAEMIALPIQIGYYVAQAGLAIGKGLRDGFIAAKNAVVEGVTNVVTFFQELPGKVIAAVASLVIDFSNWAHDVWNSAAIAVGEGINNVLQFFRDLPGKAIDAVSNLLSSFSDWWHQVWNSSAIAVGQGINNVISFFRGLPAKALAAIQSLGNSLFNLLQNAWNSAKNAVVTGVNNVVDFIRGLPGKALQALGNIGDALYNAGRNIIEGFIRGIKAAAGAIGNVIGDILSKARRLLPFSPAKEGPFSGRGWTLYSGMALIEGLAQGLRAASGDLFKEAATMAAGLQAALELTPTVNLPDTGSNFRVPDLTRGPQQTATQQLLTLQALADSLVAQGQTLPEDLAAALEQLRVVVSADEADSQLKKVDQTNARRR